MASCSKRTGGGRAAAVLRLGRCGLEQRGDVLVGSQGRGGQVPGSPVRLVVQCARQLAVRSGAPGKGRGVVNGGADQGMGEPQPGPVYLDQAQLLGRHEGPRIWPGAVAGCCAQVRAVGHGGQQHRGLRLLGQGGEPGSQDGGQPVSGGQRLGGPAAAGRGILGDHLGQLDQRHGIAGGLGEHLGPRPPAGRARLPVQQPPGVIGGERLQVQLGEAAVEARRRGLIPGADQQHDPIGVQAAAGEGQRVQRAAVQPVGVVGHHQDRGVRTDPTAASGRPPRSAAGPEHRGPQKDRAPPAGPGPAGREARRRPAAPAAAADAARRTRAWTPIPGR